MTTIKCLEQIKRCDFSRYCKTANIPYYKNSLIRIRKTINEIPVEKTKSLLLSARTNRITLVVYKLFRTQKMKIRSINRCIRSIREERRTATEWTFGTVCALLSDFTTSHTCLRNRWEVMQISKTKKKKSQDNFFYIVGRGFHRQAVATPIIVQRMNEWKMKKRRKKKIANQHSLPIWTAPTEKRRDIHAAYTHNFSF